MNTENRKKSKRWLAAGFFVVVLLITVGPLALLRSPAPAGQNDGIAYCAPEYNPGPEGVARLSAIQDSSPLITLRNEQEGWQADTELDVESLNGISGLLTYDSRLTRFWLDAVAESGVRGAIPATVEEARRLSSNPAYSPCSIH